MRYKEFNLQSLMIDTAGITDILFDPRNGRFGNFSRWVNYFHRTIGTEKR